MTVMPEAQQQLNCNIRECADGTKRFIFVLAPQGQFVGELKVEAADAQLLPAMAQTFANWVNAQKPGVQLAPATALEQLEKLRTATRPS
jgi:hypothetical protein